ncbi:MAG: DUF5717 family protein [[Clostridium] scindens]
MERYRARMISGNWRSRISLKHGRLFRSREFYEILKYENERIFYLYDNMRKWSLGEQAMEEFLVGIKQKECIFLDPSGRGNAV